MVCSKTRSLWIRHLSRFGSIYEFRLRWEVVELPRDGKPLFLFAAWLCPIFSAVDIFILAEILLSFIWRRLNWIVPELFLNCSWIVTLFTWVHMRSNYEARVWWSTGESEGKGREGSQKEATDAWWFDRCIKNNEGAICLLSPIIHVGSNSIRIAIRDRGEIYNYLLWLLQTRSSIDAV